MPTMLELQTARSQHGTGRTTSCRFCDLAAHESPLLEAESTSIFASLGAYVAGWVLAVPNRHVLALSELTDAEWKGFSQIVDLGRERVADKWGSTIAFEHGVGASGRQAGCGVDHAHLHLVPLDLDLRFSISLLEGSVGRFDWEECNGRPRSRDELDYIYLSDKSGSRIAYRADIPSQVVRRAIASHLGVATWNWRDDHRVEVADLTRRRWHERQV